jgi:transposase
LVLPEARLTPSQQDYVRALIQACEPLRIAQELAVEFGRLIRTPNVAALEPWLTRAEGSGLREFRDFAAGLRDAAAVRAAIEQTWSNGQTEGQVNKLKMLKRQMYGRASVALLDQRMRAAA